MAAHAVVFTSRQLLALVELYYTRFDELPPIGEGDSFQRALEECQAVAIRAELLTPDGALDGLSLGQL
jgi:hypothetical protein